MKGTTRLIERAQSPLPPLNGEKRAAPLEPEVVRESARHARATSREAIEKSVNLRQRMSIAKKLRASRGASGALSPGFEGWAANEIEVP